MAAPVRARLTPAELRRFGLTLGAAFGVLAAVLAWRGRGAWSVVPLALAVALVGGALLRPTALDPVERGWMALAHRLSAVTTPIVLGLLYFGVLTPMGWVLRHTGRGPLPRPRPGESGWVPREAGHRRSDLSRQF